MPFYVFSLLNIRYVEDYQRGEEREGVVWYTLVMKHRVGVTGHRKLLGKHPEVFAKTKEVMKEIQERCQAQCIPIEVNTGMALGFDQLICEICLELGIPYVAVIPFHGQETVWPLPQQERYFWLIERASSVVAVNQGPYEAWKMHARNGWIVNNSDEMVVHWDGFYQGGTGGCMKLVKSKRLNWRNTV